MSDTDVEKIWYIVVQGKADGPHMPSAIENRLKKGLMTYSDLVFRPGFTRWVPVAECVEFERRTETDISLKTAIKLEVPKDKNTRGWVLLVKHASVEGKNHYIQSGPYSNDQIQEKLKKGEVKFEDHVWQRGYSQWTSIGEIEDFDRRRPKIFETQPKPENSKVESMNEFSTAILENKIVIQQGTDPGASQATATGSISSEEKSAKLGKAPVPKPSQDESTMEIHGVRGTFIRRVFIGTGGALLSMAITYAGILAYRNNTKGQIEPIRVVASENAVAPETAKAPQPISKDLPSVNPSVVPTNPEMENRIAKKAQVLKIRALKSTSQKPQLAIETDLAGGSELEVEISAQPGSILKYPSFFLTKKVTINNGQLPTLDLTDENLPAGEYRAVVTGGEMKASSGLSIGVHDKAFKQKLAEFKKLVMKQQKSEISKLQEGAKFAARAFSSLTSEYRIARMQSSAQAKAKWNKLLKNWRKDLKQELKSLKNVNEGNKNAYVFPDQLLHLKGLEQSLAEIAGVYDQSVKRGRQIASEDDIIFTFKDSLKKFQRSLKGSSSKHTKNK